MNSDDQSRAEAAIRAFFDAMNSQDADAAVALTREDVVIAFGPNELEGHEALRELATQVDDQLSAEITPVDIELQSPSSVRVSAQRIDRWRSTGETATEREVQARFSLDADGAITRVEFA